MKVSFDALCELYMMNLLTLKRARDHMPNLKKHYDTLSFTVGDLVIEQWICKTILVTYARLISMIYKQCIQSTSSCPTYHLQTYLVELQNISMIQEHFTINWQKSPISLPHYSPRHPSQILQLQCLLLPH